MYGRFENMPANMWTVWIIPIILLIIIVISVYMIWKNKEENDRSESSPALEILNERFAKGEIDEDEYKNIKKNLTNLE